MKAALYHKTESHGDLRLILSIANDIWHAIGSDNDFSAFNPLPQNVSCAFIVTCFLTHGIELILETLDAFALVFDLALVLVIDCIHDLLNLVLVAHLSLGSPPLASCLQDVDTSSLGR